MFSKLSLRWQILLGFAPSFLLIGLVVFNNLNNISLFKSDLETLERIRKENLLILEIEKALLEYQRHVLVHTYVGYGGVLRKTDFLEKMLSNYFSELREFSVNNPEVEERFTRMHDHYQDYVSSFEKAVFKRREIDNIVTNKIKPTFQKIVESFNEVANYNLTNQKVSLSRQVLGSKNTFLGIYNQLLETNFSPDFRTGEKIYADLDAIRNELKKSPEPNTLLALLDDYQNSIRKLIRFNRTYLQLINVVMAGKAAEINLLAVELQETMNQNALLTQNRINQNLSNSQYFSGLLSLLAIVLAIISGLLVARNISKPVQEMSTALALLAQGKSDVVIPGQNRSDEVGSMAHAAQSFKLMATNIEAQKVALEESKIKLQAILDNMIDGLITINNEGIIESYNKACEDILGYPLEYALGKNIKFLMPEPYHSEHDGYLQNYRISGKPKIIGIGREVTALHKDGSVIPIELSVSEMKFGNRTLFSGIIRDITERKKAEEDLIAANEELEEFAYRTSHDLRSPLVSSSAVLSLAENALNDGDINRTQQCIELVRESLNKLETLVLDILALTETRNVEEEWTELKVKDIVHNSLEKLSHMENFSRIDFKTDNLQDLTLKTKPSRFTLIIENMISNAIKYQNPEEPEPYFLIKAKTLANNTCELVFEDNGLGIAKKKQDKMFQMFARFHPKVSFGSGLGLYMIKKSVTIIGGDIRYEGLKKGSRFVMTMPVNG